MRMPSKNGPVVTRSRPKSGIAPIPIARSVTAPKAGIFATAFLMTSFPERTSQIRKRQNGSNYSKSTRNIMEQPKLGTGDIQGLIVSGYDKMKEATFLLLTITDAADGRKWLSSLLSHITPVRERSELLRLAHRTHVNIAFTHEGLKALGLG